MAPTLALLAQHEPRQHYRRAVRRKTFAPNLSCCSALVVSAPSNFSANTLAAELGLASACVPRTIFCPNMPLETSPSPLPEYLPHLRMKRRDRRQIIPGESADGSREYFSSIVRRMVAAVDAFGFWCRSFLHFRAPATTPPPPPRATSHLSSCPADSAPSAGKSSLGDPGPPRTAPGRSRPPRSSGRAPGRSSSALPEPTSFQAEGAGGEGSAPGCQ